MRNKYSFATFIALFVFLIGHTQEKKQVKANEHWKSSSMKIVKSLSSKKSLIPAEKKEGEVKDGRSSRYNPIIGKGSTGDDILAKNPNRLKNKIPGQDPKLVFDTAESNSQPTDPALAVGRDHVIAVFNTGYRIFDKQGQALTGELSVENIFDNGGCCDLTASYDNAADRWVITYLFFSGEVQVAVSQGPDPVNDSWAVYTFPGIDDYQKLSVWSDGYYLTANKNFSTASTSNVVFALDRTAMLNGEGSAQIIGFPLPGISTNGFYSPQAFNITDRNPPAPGNAPIVYLQDDAFNGISQDHLKIWTINVDFNNPANSIISQPSELVTTPFVSVFDGGSFSNLTQPNGGQAIDALQGTIMNQAQFKKFDTHNSAVFNFVVDTDVANEIAGVRWYELRQDGDGQPWSIYQEGTYTSPDGKHAWNASLAMDENGNIGMGYTAMGGNTNTFVSSFYTGRFASDPLGIMTFDETLLAPGSGNIPGSERYGDYSKIDVDPENNKNFWFVNEYVNADNNRANVAGVFRIAAELNNDLAVSDLEISESGTFSENVEITITLTNFGIEDLSNFEVSYQVNNGNVVTETFTGTLASETNVDYTFTQTADLSTEGETYSILATVILTGDENESNNSIEESFTSSFANDLSISSIISPVTDNALSEENVTVVIENKGGVAQSNFEVSYILNSNPIVIETVNQSIEPNESLNYTFDETADLSESGIYEFVVNVELENDIDSSNNTFEFQVDSQTCTTIINDNQEPVGPNAGTITTSRLNFGEDFIIGDVNVTVNIEHTFVEDLVLVLTAPDGETEVILSDRNGGGSQNYTNTIFDLSAQTPISAGVPPFTGSFVPDGDLSVFQGLSSLGEWTLNIEDTFNEDGGSLLNWGLEICEVSPVLSITDKFPEDSEFLILDNGDNQFEIIFKTEDINERLTLNVFNMLGQKLLDYKLDKTSGQYQYHLDMSYGQTGIYIVTLNDGSRAVTGRVVKR